MSSYKTAKQNHERIKARRARIASPNVPKTNEQYARLTSDGTKAAQRKANAERNKPRPQPGANGNGEPDYSLPLYRHAHVHVFVPRNMPTTRIRSIEEIEAALTRHDGFLSFAAADLEMSQVGLSARIKRSERLQQTLAQIREHRLDVAESRLHMKIMDGNLWAITFYLRCLGKERGYVERHEVSGPESGPIEVKAFDYGSAVAAITRGSKRDSAAPGETEVRGDGATLGKVDDGG